MEEILERIKHYMEVEKLNGASLGRLIGMSTQTVNQYLSHKRGISLEFIVSILNNCDKMSSEWLLRGRGEIYVRKDSNEYIRQLEKELADVKVENLVQKGVTEKLCKIIEEKMNVSSSDKEKRNIG